MFSPASAFSIIAHSYWAFSVFLALLPCLPNPKVANQTTAWQWRLKSVSPTVPNYFHFLFEISSLASFPKAHLHLVYILSILAFRCLQCLCSCSCYTKPDSSIVLSDFSTSVTLFFFPPLSSFPFAKSVSLFICSSSFSSRLVLISTDVQFS